MQESSKIRPVPAVSESGPAGASGASSDVVELLRRIDGRLGNIERRLSAFEALTEQVTLLGATVGDAFDRYAADNELHERVQAVLRAVDHLTRPETMAQIEKLLDLADMSPHLLSTATDSFDAMALEMERQGIDLGTLIPRVLGLLTAGARAMQQAHEAEPVQPGFFALLRALKDPEVRRATGVAIAFAKSMGSDLQSTQDTPALPSHP